MIKKSLCLTEFRRQMRCLTDNTFRLLRPDEKKNRWDEYLMNLAKIGRITVQQAESWQKVHPWKPRNRNYSKPPRLLIRVL